MGQSRSTALLQTKIQWNNYNIVLVPDFIWKSNTPTKKEKSWRMRTLSMEKFCYLDISI